jgi:protocatechuate 3,4-dioxygenase alpha subunit
MRLTPSASQTVGPFFNFALTPNEHLGVMARDGAEGERIALTFRVVDGDGVATPGDSMIELWQADARGRYTHGADPNFCGFGRLETDVNGECTFATVKPGAVTETDGSLQAPHINVIVFARGLLKHLYTRVYFEGEAANAHDGVLALVPEDRRGTLMARQVAGAWRMEIRLQGEGETVFFDV